MSKLDEYALQVPGVKGYVPDLKKVEGYEPNIKEVVVDNPDTPEVETLKPRPYKVPSYGPRVKKVLGYNPSTKNRYPVFDKVVEGYIMDTFMRAWEENDCEPVTREQIQKRLDDAGDRADLDKWLSSLSKAGKVVKMGDKWLPNIYGGC